jgi:hypothetical protein
MPDQRVSKREKKSLKELRRSDTNGDLHYTGVLFVNNEGRLKTSLEDHFVKQQKIYTSNSWIKSITARPIVKLNAELLADYSIKYAKSERRVDLLDFTQWYGAA